MLYIILVKTALIPSVFSPIGAPKDLTTLKSRDLLRQKRTIPTKDGNNNEEFF